MTPISIGMIVAPEYRGFNFELHRQSAISEEKKKEKKKVGCKFLFFIERGNYRLFSKTIK